MEVPNLDFLTLADTNGFTLIAEVPEDLHQQWSKGPEPAFLPSRIYVL
jgi:hypothetical protein